jgi:hypothetical protein
VRLGAGWSLSASGTTADFDSVSGKEILGVTLARARSDRARELHARRVHLDAATISFDGIRGRWRTSGTAGKHLAVDMSITARGAPKEVAVGESLPFACRGSFVRVPVTLTGRFVVRTGTKALETITRDRLAGVVTYNRGGPVECGLATRAACESSASLTAAGGSATGSQSLSVDRGGRSMVLQLAQPRSGWAHVLLLSRVDVLAGELPTIRLQVPAKLPVTGSATFVAGETTESVEGGCRTATTTGELRGTLVARFAAWGARTFGVAPTRGYLTARYRVTTPV